jgi:hypothetical protein
LSDYLINAISEDEAILSNLVSRNADFNKEKISLKELINKKITPLELIVEKLGKISFHNLGVARSMYRAAFDINFPDFGILAVAIDNRHDIVHRNGRKKGEDHF